MSNEDDTVPGLEQAPDGTFTIGPAASKASRDRAEKEAFDHANNVIAEINVETEKPADPDYIQPK